MELTNSPKKYEKYKSSPPETTIATIEKGFRELGIELEYFSKQTSAALKIHSGGCRIKNTPIKTNGKGCSYLLSKASAYAEMAERFSSGALFDDVRNLWKCNHLPLEVQIEKDTIDYCVNRKFYKGYRYKDLSCSVPQITADRFRIPYDHMNEKLKNLFQSDWSKLHLVDGYSLTKNQKVSIPIKHLESVAGSNGLAAGNTIEEAITQGTCEIFERFCLLQIMKNGYDVPTIDPSSIENNQIKELIRYYNDLNIEVKIKDFSMEGRFPVIGAVFINHNLEGDVNPLKKDLFYHQIKAGAALNPEEALIRCLIERMQGRTPKEMMISPIIDIVWQYWVKIMKKPYKGHFDYRLMFSQGLVFGGLPFLMTDKDVIPFNAFKKKANDDFLDDAHQLINICAKENVELIVIDITHPTIGFPAVRALIPEMSCILLPGTGFQSIFSFPLFEDQWFDDDTKIKEFIRTTEEYLSYNLYSDKIYTIFGREISLFEVLCIAKLKIRDYREALQCFLLTKDLTGTNKYDDLIDLLLNREYRAIKTRYSLKNPLIHGWNFEEKAINEFMIPIEMKKIFECLENCQKI